MADLNVTYQDMTDAAARLTAGEQDLTAKLTELNTLVNNLVANGYVTDQSSRAFDDTFNQFITGTKQVVEGLGGLSKYLTAAANALQATDQQLAQTIKGH